MMRNQLLSASAAILALFAAGLSGAARAEDARPGARSSFEVCQFSSGGGGCTHFQGYVYVRPEASTAPAFVTDGKAAAESGRLYIHVGNDEAR
jgi:hypothetical protein